MNKRTIVTILSLLLCLGSVWAVIVQNQRLGSLRAQRDQQAVRAQEKPGKAVEETLADSTNSADTSGSELLRLRSEVTRLTARKRDLAGVLVENERLQAELANSQTNVPPGSRLPAGYIRKNQAQMVGYSTPENTVQSFLWALQQRDTAALMQCLVPAEAERLQSRIQSSSDGADGLFRGAAALPGMGIQSRKILPDGSTELQAIFVPSMPAQTLRFQLINGEWKFTELGL